MTDDNESELTAGSGQGPAAERERLLNDAEFPDLGRLIRTALLEMQARAMAVEAAVEMLLAAEAGRNPGLPQAMKGKLADMLSALPEPSDPELPSRIRAAFYKLLVSADAAAEEAKVAQSQQKAPSVWDSLRGRK